MQKSPDCIVILGPTASGKTALAVQVASALNAEIISADSRQVYRKLDIGTGKDLNSYFFGGQQIRYHLIDVAEAGEQFFLHDYIVMFNEAFDDIRNRGKLPLICGGTGMYLDALRKDYSFTQIKEDHNLRAALNDYPKEQLITELQKFPAYSTLHVDRNSKKRLIRGIEVARYLSENPMPVANKKPEFNPVYFGIDVDHETRKELIMMRLHQRLKEGLIQEVKHLIGSGITHDRLQNLGLEYKFISLYLQEKISEESMISQLTTAICQYSKRQMTWFRKMEKEGVKITWVNKNESEKVIDQCKKIEFQKR